MLAKHAYYFAAELFLVGLLMVSTLRFPSFKKKSQSPRAAMGLKVAFVGILCLMIIFRQYFFIGFFIVYILAGLLLNLAWSLGWRGVEPPHAPDETDPGIAG